MITNIGTELKRGIITENPIFVLALGLCPSLGVSTSVSNGLGMGLAATFVLVASNIIISMLKKVIPDQVRIPAYITIIAAFVSILQMIMEAYLPSLFASLGIFIPLIVVNCIILGRAEAYAAKNSVFKSAIDGIVMGLGFTVALVILSVIREVLGANKLWGLEFIPGFQPMTIFILAPGGFFTMAFVIGMINFFKMKKERK